MSERQELIPKNNGEEKEEEGNGAAGDSPLMLPSPWLQNLLFGCLLQNIMFGGGVVLGVQSIYGALENRGFCADRCSTTFSGNNGTAQTTTSAPPSCVEQRKCLAHAVNLACSMLNLGALPVGLASDALGGLTSYVLGTVLLTVSINLFAVSSGDALGLSIGLPISTIGTSLIFFPAITKILPAFLKKSKLSMFSSIYTSFWDFAILVSVLPGLMLDNTSLSAAMVFFIFSLLSLPAAVIVIALVVWRTWQVRHEAKQTAANNQTVCAATPPAPPPPTSPPNRIVESNTNDDNVQQRTTEEEQDQIPVTLPPASPLPQSSSFGAVLCRILLRRRIYGLMAGGISTVTFGYFLMANAGLLVLSKKGGTEDEAHNFERWGSVIMGVLGAAVGIVVGMILNNFAALTDRVVRIMSLVQLALLALIIGIVAIDELSWQAGAYIPWTLMVVWRMLGFTGINAAWASEAIASGDSSAIGTGIGLIYTVAGGVSTIVGHFATSLAHDGHYKEVTIILGCACCGFHILHAAL